MHEERKKTEKQHAETHEECKKMEKQRVEMHEEQNKIEKHHKGIQNCLKLKMVTMKKNLNIITKTAIII